MHLCSVRYSTFGWYIFPITTKNEFNWNHANISRDLALLLSSSSLSSNELVILRSEY